jgi:multiple sugar transport system permease protein
MTRSRPPPGSRVAHLLPCYLYILPNAALFLLLTALPVVFSLILSLYDWSGKDLDWSKFRFVGLANFRELLAHGDFWLYLSNTVFLMLAIPVSIALHLGVALVMNRKIREVVVYRTAWFMPSVASGVGILLLWQWVFSPDAGLLNAMLSPLLRLLHLPKPQWLLSETYVGAKSAFMIMGLWSNAGGMGVLLYLAALQGVPRSLYEAAAGDCAH